MENPSDRLENVYLSGWNSGASITVEPVPAGQVRRGDRIAYDGRVFTVTAGPAGAVYRENGELVSGVAIITACGSARWTLYRQPDEVLYRIT